MSVGTVSSKVHSLRRVHLAFVAGESLVIGCSAGLLTVATAVAGGARSTESQAIAVAGLIACLAAANWIVARRGSAASVARAIDRDAGFSGALITAFEAEARPPRSPLVEILAARVAPAISTASFLRDRLRSSAILLAAPFVSAAVWGLAADGLPARGGSGPPSASASVVAQAEILHSKASRLASVLGISGPEIRRPGVSTQAVAEIRVLLEDVERIRRAAHDPGVTAEALAADLRAVARRFQALESAVQDHGVTPGALNGTMAGPDARTGSPPNASMKDPLPPSDALPQARAPGPGPESGVGRSRWWPERYDSVVERWIESRRAAGEIRPR